MGVGQEILPHHSTGPGPLDRHECLFCKLLHFNGCAGIRELFPDGLSFVLADAFLNRLRRAVHQVFGFLQAQAGHFANNLNDIDFVRARRLATTDVM